MSTPTVSIGLPVFNGARYLRTAIEDFLAQTYTDWELIVCDNASTDDTQAIVEALARQEARIRYHRNPENLGALPNANRAFRLARGRYYVLAAHDDRHTPDFLQQLVGALDADPEAVLAYPRSHLIGENDERLAYDASRGVYVASDGRAVGYAQDLERPMPVETVARYRAVLRSGDINAPIHGLFRREALAQTDGHQFHGSDRLIVSHTALLGRFVFVDAPLFGFRIHPESTLFLDRDAWAERETGRGDADSPLATLVTFRNYLRAVRQSPITASERMRARVATFGYLVRPSALRNAFLPGPDNYFGWRRWPWQPRTRRPRRVGGHEDPQASVTDIDAFATASLSS